MSRRINDEKAALSTRRDVGDHGKNMSPDPHRKNRRFKLISGRTDESRGAGTRDPTMTLTGNRDKPYSHDE
jgi:hypothetical protein